MKELKILTVCGSGTVSSAMIAEKLKDRLGEYGYDVKAVETSPGNLENTLAGGGYDLIAYTSPISGEFGIPKVNAIGFLTGLEEDEFIEEVLEILKNLEK